MHQTDILFQVALAIVTATAFALVAKWLRQPLILGYVAAGILLGPTEGIGVLSPENIEPVAELGLVLLLFMIGLDIDLKKLRSAGAPVIAAGILQFPVCVALGLLAMPLLGLREEDAASHAVLYLAVGAALSSTMIVVKLLYDKQELDTLAGRVCLGVLVFQDIWAILFLAVQGDLQAPRLFPLVLSLAKGVGLIAFALGVSRYALPILFRFIAKVPELLVLGALGWCFLVALIAQFLGLSLEMGALIAGVALSTFPYNLDVIAKVISLRDFFITLFFVSLGSRIPRPSADVLLAALGVSAFLVASRLVSLVPLLHRMGLGNRASLLPAVNLSQMSEFSLVICSIGLGMGHVGQRTLSIVVFTFVLTSIASTYAIQYNDALYRRVGPLLARLGLRDRRIREGSVSEIPARPLVLVGFHRHASSLLHELLARDSALRDRIGVIDFNPQVKDELDRRGIANVYGDVSHPDTLHHANVGAARVLACTLPDGMLRGTTNMRLLRQLQRLAPDAKVVVTADRLEDARALYGEGAAYVYIPRLAGARALAEIVLTALDGDVAPQRRAALAEIEDRTEVME